MSIITIYPTIPDVATEDLLIISDISKEGNPTRTVSIGQLSGALSPPTGISLTTLTTSGASTIVGNVLNIPIYQGSITLTTLGTSGVATFTGDTLNIPNYASGGSVATSLVTGTVKLNSDVVQSTAANSITTTALRTYGVQFNGSGQMVVNVPWISGGGSGSVDAIINTSPLTMSPAGGVGTVTLGIQLADTNQSGYLSTSDWDLFNNKQDTITLTTNGTTGAATLVGATLNIPQYAGIGSGVTSVTGTLPITVSASTGAVDIGVNTSTITALGVSKLGSSTVQSEAPVLASSTASRTYPIQHNLTDQMVVNVPWTSSGATATATVLGSVKLNSNSQQAIVAQSITATINRTYGIQFNSNDQMVVNVPWTDNGGNTATASVLGIVKLGSDTKQTTAFGSPTTTALRSYPVQFMDTGDQMVVNVPWTDGGSLWSAGIPANTIQLSSPNTKVGIGIASPGVSLEVSGAISLRDLGSSTFVGYRAGQNDDLTNNFNSAFGDGALQTNTTGSRNIAIGGSALNANIVGNDNTAVGYYALGDMGTATAGNDNVAIGHMAGRYEKGIGGNPNTRSMQSVFIGSDTLANTSNFTNQIVIGYGAIGGGDNTVVIGNASVTLNTFKGRLVADVLDTALYTYASLIAAYPAINSNKGLKAMINDSTTPSWRGTASGGGGIAAEVFCDGANWIWS